MVSVLEAVLLPWVAVMLALVEEATGVVVMANVAVVAPAATVTVAGTDALVEPELKETETPPVGAPELSVTVPVEDRPPKTDVGESDNEVSATGLIVRVAVTEPPPDAAVIVGVEPVVEATVLTVNVPDVLPDGIVIEAGTVALALLDVSVTTVPAAGAALLSVTVPVTVLPAMTDVGERVTEAG